MSFTQETSVQADMLQKVYKLHSAQANYAAKSGDRLCKAIFMLPISVVMAGIQRVR